MFFFIKLDKFFVKSLDNVQLPGPSSQKKLISLNEFNIDKIKIEIHSPDIWLLQEMLRNLFQFYIFGSNQFLFVKT